MKKLTLTEQFLFICIAIIVIVIISLGMVLPRTLLPVYEENLYNYLNQSLNLLEKPENDRFFMDVSDIIVDDDLSLKTAINRFKKKYIERILEMTKNNQTKAAKLLDIQRTYLARLLTELDIRE